MVRAILPAFIDTSYIFALLNRRDERHAIAVEWESRLAADRHPLASTQFVLTEIADGLASHSFRQRVFATIGVLLHDPNVEIVPATDELFHAALHLFGSRADKDWSLTDCSSFVVMQKRGLSDALTTDRHFIQAGFRAPLLEP